jgi:hypothetical protein
MIDVTVAETDLAGVGSGWGLPALLLKAGGF